MSDSEHKYVPVEAWCGYIDQLTGSDQHPPHLWAEIVMFPTGPRMNIHPCPGERLS